MSYARELGLDHDQFVQILDSRKYFASVERDIAEGKRLGVTGTPTFFINGNELVGGSPKKFKDLINSKLTQLNIEIPENAVNQDQEIASLGPADAPVKLVLFADFQSPTSAKAAFSAKEVVSLFPDKVRFEFKHFPLPFHKKAHLAHELAVAAGKKGKFWEMHNLLFQNTKKLSKDNLREYAISVGLDSETIDKAITRRNFQESVRQDIIEGKNRRVRGVPNYFINGKRFDGVQTVSALESAIEQELTN